MNIEEFNNVDELIEKGFIERVFMKSPAGGDYLEAHYYDKDWKYTAKDVAQYMVVKEYNAQNEVIKETVMVRKINYSSKKNR